MVGPGLQKNYRKATCYGIEINGIAARANRVLKKYASGRDPVLFGSCNRLNTFEYATLSKSPNALPDGATIVFQQPDRACLNGLA
jgi:hypothetical protein